MFVCCECCVLSGRGLWDQLITRPEESYRLWCVVVCDLENLVNEEAMIPVGMQHHKKKFSGNSCCFTTCQVGSKTFNGGSVDAATRQHCYQLDVNSDEDAFH
jgi:hypothetical protein